VEHEARVLLALGEEAGQVPLEREGGRLPLDALVDASVRGKDDVAYAQHDVLHRVVVARKPPIDLFAARHRRYLPPRK
jgi:hypothetical protein